MKIGSFLPVFIVISLYISYCNGQCGPAVGYPSCNGLGSCGASCCCSIYDYCGTGSSYCGTNCLCDCPTGPTCASLRTSVNCSSYTCASGTLIKNANTTVCNNTICTDSQCCNAGPLTGNTSYCGNYSPNRKDNFAVYWGQGYSTGEGSLASYCNDDVYQVFLISFLYQFPLPSTLLYGCYHCSSTSCGSALYPDILCSTGSVSVATDIAYCQSRGKKVMISLGGSNGNYGFTSSAQAVGFATTMWQMFFGGSNASVPRPFGSVSLDGIDLDIEAPDPSANYYPDLINQLRSLFNSDTTKTYYVSAAPQCPFRDDHLGPDGLSWDGNTLTGKVLSNSYIDFVNLQFYNNPSCDIGGTGFVSSYYQWAGWANTSLNPNAKILVGFPGGAADASTGAYDAATVISNLAKVKSNPNFGGAMSWESGLATSTGVAAAVAAYLHEQANSCGLANCSLPIVVANGTAGNCSTGLLVGAYCTPACNSGFIGSLSAICNATKQWSVTGVCTKNSTGNSQSRSHSLKHTTSHSHTAKHTPKHTSSQSHTAKHTAKHTASHSHTAKHTAKHTTSQSHTAKHTASHSHTAKYTAKHTASHSHTAKHTASHSHTAKHTAKHTMSHSHTTKHTVITSCDALPKLPNSDYTLGTCSSLGLPVSSGSSCTFSCNHGTKESGSLSVVCTNTKWSTPTGACKKSSKASSGSASTSSSKKNDSGAIAGGIIGGLIAALLIAFVAYKLKQRANGNDGNGGREMGDVQMTFTSAT